MTGRYLFGIDLAERSRATSIAMVKDSDLTWVHDPASGGDFALLQVDGLSGLWVVRSRFPAGSAVGLHLHTGPVWAVTLSGRWRYPELSAASEPGDFLIEEAGTVHSLTVTGDATADIVFGITGAIVYFSADGTAIDRIEDWRSVLQEYKQGCADLGQSTRVLGAPTET